MADRFFDVGIFASLHGPDTRECVPVIGCGGADEVDGFVVECLTHINNGLRAGSLFLLDFITPFIGDRFVGIDDDSNFRAFIPQIFIYMRCTATIDADDGHAQFFILRYSRATDGRCDHESGRSDRR